MKTQHWLFNLPLDSIKKASIEHNTPLNLMIALVSVESNGNPNAMKYEIKYQKYTINTRAFATNNQIDQITEEQLQMFSYGLGQLMGGKCREMGHQGSLLELLQPELNLFYMCKLLKILVTRYSTQREIIASYNSGSPIQKIGGGGAYINELYVDKVSLKLRELDNLFV